MAKNQFDLLKTRRFLPLFITQFLGAFNDNIFKNGLVILITYRLATEIHYNAQMLVTFAAGIFILPFFLFSATAGQFADKYEKSHLISIVKFFEILLMILAAIGFYRQDVYLLLFTLFLLGVQATFFGPLKYAILPEHLQENELIAGNGLIDAGTFTAILLGTLLGGLLILHPWGVYLITLVLFTVAIGGWLTSWSIPKTHLYNPSLRVNYNFIKQTYLVIKYIKGHREIFLAVLGISWFWLIGATFLAEFPVFAKDILNAEAEVVTFFLVLFTIGIAIGALLCNRLLKGRIDASYVPLAAIGITIFTIDLYFASNQVQLHVTEKLSTLQDFLSSFNSWHISVDLLLIAICGGIYSVPLYAILQQRSEKTYRARVIAGNNIVNAFFMVLAALVTMLMLEWNFTVSQVFLVVGIMNAAVALYICKLLPEALKKAFFRWVLKAVYRVKVQGLENYDKAGDRVVIIANHTSFLDGALLAAFLPDKLTFAVNTITAKKWWIRFFLMLVDAYPLNPTHPMALKSLIEFVKQNKKCVIFPEGRITVTGALMKIYEGPGLIADKSGAKLLPIVIQGAQYTPFSRLRGKVHIRWAPKITLTIFPPQMLETPPNIKGRMRRQLIGQKLYILMTNAMFEGSYYQETLFKSLLDAQTIHGRWQKIVEDIERIPINYQQLISRSLILGAKIANKTLPGEYVGILLPNILSAAITFFAMQAFCRVPVILNFSTGLQNVIAACQVARIRIIYTSRGFINAARLQEMMQQIKRMGIQIHYLEDINATISWRNKLTGKILTQCAYLYYKWVNSKALRTPHNPAVVLFTSGSEAMPKGVVLSHTNIQANRLQLSACIDFTENDKVFNPLPIFHSFGLTAGMLLPLLSGVKVFLYPSPVHYRVIPELIYDTNATILFGTDIFLAGYAKHAHHYDFYSVRYVFSGAEKLRDTTRLEWSQKFGVRIFEGYGTTETSPVLAMNTPMQNKVGTVGRLLPGIDYRLAPVPGIEDGGVLIVSGPNIMLGYLLADNPGVIVAPKQGWYDTGDIVSMDADGYLTIKGRVKRFAKIAGEMVSLALVEQYLNSLWPGFQHAVVAVAGVRKGEQLVAVTTYPDATREEIIQHVKTHQFGEITIPKKIIIIERMPLLASGKIDYVQVKELVGGG